MAQSPELAGGDGFTYEGNVAAFYLSALLAQDYAIGIENKVVSKVSFQQRDFDEPLDDVIVDFEDSDKNPARLSLQVKRSLIISQAATNKAFRDIIRDSWTTLNQQKFRIDIDRYGVAVGDISHEKERALKTLCEWARDSVTTEHFEQRFKDGGVASKAVATVKNDINVLLEEITGTVISNDKLHKFLKHFILIKFDFLNEGAVDDDFSIKLLKNSLDPKCVNKAPLIWSKLVQLARASAGKAGEFDRKRLVHSISSLVRLKGATSFANDLERISVLANSYADLIQDDIGGERLERHEKVRELEDKLSLARIVQVRGLPGSGKSVMIKQAVQRALNNGPTLFLKAEQLEGTSWVSYATSQGITSISLEELLLEIGAVGTPILFIDAIDRIDKQKQGIIIDLFREIVNSTLLVDWKIVVSLRDTGIEQLNNWLGDYLNKLNVETLSLDKLSDTEAETLATAKPSMRSLLFGSYQMKEIVRRPFFAKVLNQAYAANPYSPQLIPLSEIDLIENWWKRGGYNENGQNVIDRQQTLLDLATARSRQLNKPIRLRTLPFNAHIENLQSDGIIQTIRPGITVQFSHDIFFEWSFLYVLIDHENQWVDEIKACGEAPALARSVQLFSQYEYGYKDDWCKYLAQAEDSNLRTQWLRAWLLGPFGTSKFNNEEPFYFTALFADDFNLFKKTLVWFQAEKTIPNTQIISPDLSVEERQCFADLFSWPSDYNEWNRFIIFILHHISIIPPRLYPEVIAVFEVWQNATAQFLNPVSYALLQQCSDWLVDIEGLSTLDRPHERHEYWKNTPNLSEFKTSLSQLLLKASKSVPIFAENHLQRLINSKKIENSDFKNIISLSSILAQSLPQLIVDLSIGHLCNELPEDKVKREEKQLNAQSARRKIARTKPEAERTREDNIILSNSGFFHGADQFSSYDFERLCIEDDYQMFSLPSPLREPFQSLFKYAPKEALKLFSKLCNHATKAWQQLHYYMRAVKGTPIPLKIEFPWGEQIFWGTGREYLWCTSNWSPNVISCGYMALQQWCFRQIENDQDIDELIKTIVKDNESIAILGVASMIALHYERVSEVTLPMISSQRLLLADRQRKKQNLNSISNNCFGFSKSTDKPHVDAINKANANRVHRYELSDLLPHFIFSEEHIAERARSAILNFKNNLAFEYKEQQNHPEYIGYLLEQAEELAAFADKSNYRASHTAEEDKIAIVHVSPSVTSPENIARKEDATKFLTYSHIHAWVDQCLSNGQFDGQIAIENAIAIVRKADTESLFEQSMQQTEDAITLSNRQAAVAATACLLLTIEIDTPSINIEWARDVLKRVIKMPEVYDKMWTSRAQISWHPAIYAAKGIAADIRKGTACQNAVKDLFVLIAHPLEVVSLAAIKESFELVGTNPKLTWCALNLAFLLCHIPSRPQSRYYEQPLHSSVEAEAKINLAISQYDIEYSNLPLPPPAWVKVKESEKSKRSPYNGGYRSSDVIDPSEEWIEDTSWHSTFAAKILKIIPFYELLQISTKHLLLNFLTELISWTNQKNAPSWVKPEAKCQTASAYYEWTMSFGSSLGMVAGLLPLKEFHDYINPIIELEGDNCWALLEPFTNTYIRAHIYDATHIHDDSIQLLNICLERFLKDKAFTRGGYRSRDFFGVHQPLLVKALMFISVEQASLSSRYANGDWSEIDVILPIVDRFIKSGGWIYSVFDAFLTLCERAKDHYSAEHFADQVIHVLLDHMNNSQSWHGIFTSARIAGLVQHLAHREAPMNQVLAQKFLHILDILVDLGDRRSANLQRGEVFRSIRLPEKISVD